MKKSLQEARKAAQAMSEEHPEITYHVMDKKGCRACVHGSQWVYEEKVLAGWYTVARFRNCAEML